MPTLSPAQLALLRGGNQHVEVYASVLAPRVLWSAQVDDAGIDVEEREIQFDGGSGLNYTWIEAYQTLWVGTTAGANDVGKVRIKSITSGDGGVTGTVTVAANSLHWEDDHYLTFMHNYEYWSIFPRIDDNEIFYKDYDITYVDQNEEINPICIAGPHQVGFATSPGSLTYNIPIGQSYSIDPTATITNWVVTVTPSAGVTVGAMIGDDIPVTILSDAPYYKQYWVKATVTDSNGKTQTTYRSIFHHPDSRNFPFYPFVEIESVALNGSWDNGGWNLEMSLKELATETDVPNGALVLLWTRAFFDGVQTEVSFNDYAPNVIFAGYVQHDQFNKDKEQGGRVTFSAATISEVMKNRGLFSISLESVDAPQEWYEYLNGYLTCGRIVHHIYKWHSTLFEVTDVLGLDDDGDIQRFAADLERNNLYVMGDDLIRNKGIFAHLVCNKLGQLYMSRDLLLREDSVRAAANVVAVIEDIDITGEVVIVHRPITQTSFVFLSGISYDGSNKTPIGSTAPATWPDSVGSRIFHVEQQMMTDQAGSNRLAGQVYAVENNKYPEIRLTFSGYYLGVLDFALQEWWQINVASGDTVRGVVLTDQNMICRDLTVQFQLELGMIRVQATFVPETDGQDGVAYEWPDTTPDPGGEPPTIPEAAAQALLAGSSIYYQAYGEATWSELETDDMNWVVVDPYWKAKSGSTMPSDAIVMTGEEGQIRRGTSAGATLSTLSPGNPPNDYGDTPAPTLANCSIIQCVANRYLSQNFVWLVRWQNASSEWRSWYLSTDDDGSTFDWVSV